MNRKLKLRATFFTSLIILLTVAFAVYLSFRNFQSDTTWVNHSERVRLEIENYSRIPKDISYEIRSVILTHDTLNTALIREMNNMIPRIQHKLDSLISDQTQSTQLKELNELVKEYNKESSHIIDIIINTNNNLSQNDINLIHEQERLVKEIENKASYMQRIENDVINQRIEEQKASQLIAPLALLSLTILTLGIIAYLFNNAVNLYERNDKANKELSHKNKRLTSEMDQRVALESLLQNVIDSSANGIIALQPVHNENMEVTDFRISTYNKMFYKDFVAQGEQLNEQSFIQSMAKIKSKELTQSFREVVLKDKPYHQIHQFTIDETTKWFLIQAVRNSDGVVATFNDITLQKKHENELLEKQKELEDTNFELQQFAYIASHDLQEPLRKIRAFGDRLVALLKNNDEPKAADYISRMQNAAERMQKLIDDLLRFSRVSRSENTFSNVDLNAVLEQAKDNLEYDMEHKDAKILQPSLPTIKGDQGQLVQLFQNILSNAIKYSKPDLSPKIEIKVDEVKKKSKITGETDAYWEISIKDNGIGFDPAYKHKIFVIFQRLHGRTEYQGTGIGLAICEKIITNHDGLIEADSTPGEGSIFKMYFKK